MGEIKDLHDLLHVTEGGEAGEGSEAVAVQETIEELDPRTTYVFRVVAESAAGVGVGDDVEFTTLAERIAVQHEFPPDELAVRVQPPGGGPSRWAADEPLAENIIDGLEFSDEMPGGEKDGRGNLARDPRTPWPDLVPFSDVEIYGPGGEVVWQGRFGKDSHVEGDSQSIAVEFEGHSTELEDNKALKLGFIDSGMGRWGEMTNRRREVLSQGTSSVAGPNLIGPELIIGRSDDANEVAPGVIFKLGSVSSGHTPINEAHYDGGVDLGALMFDGKQLTAWAEDANMGVTGYLFSDDLGGLSTSSPAGSMKQVTKAQQMVQAPSAGYRRAVFQMAYMASLPTDVYTNTYGFLNIRVLSWLAAQSLTLQGTWPEVGYTARQMLELAITQLTGLEFDEESEDDGYIIPQAWWPDYTTLAAVVQELTRYGLLDWMVFGKKFSLRKPGTYGRKWKLSASASELQEEGVDSARSWRKITVAWPDPDGTTRTAGPPGSGADYEDAALEITDPDHSAVRAGKDRHDVLVLKGGGYPSLAIGTGVRWLVEANELSHAGSCTASGYAQNDKGIWFPVSQIRAGDQASFAETGDSSYRKITSRVYSHPERKAQLSLDAPPEGLQALLERYEADLISLGA